MKRTALKPDPDKVRAFQRRARERARIRSREPRRMPRTGFRKRSLRIPRAVRQRVYARSGRRCVRPGCGRRCTHLHHVFDQHGWPELARVEANMVGVCWGCHWRHHFEPNGRLPRTAIPQELWDLAEEIGRRAQLYLERFYPFT